MAKLSGINHQRAVKALIVPKLRLGMPSRNDPRCEK